MLILVPIAFAAGVITAFTPCILPVLPIVLAGGVGAATKRRPYAIAAGLVTTFTAFLLAGAWLWSLIGVSAKHQIKIGAALLLVLAVIARRAEGRASSSSGRSRSSPAGAQATSAAAFCSAPASASCSFPAAGLCLRR